MKFLSRENMLRCFIKGFNERNLDLLQWAVSPGSSTFGGYSFDYEHYGKIALANISYGNKKLQYVAFNPEYGYRHFRQSDLNGKLIITERELFNTVPDDLEVNILPLEDKTFNIDEFLKIPSIVKIELRTDGRPFRYSATTTFSNGEIRKYTFPFITDGKYYRDHRYYGTPYCFTDKIFTNGWLTDKRSQPLRAREEEYPICGAGLNFINGFSVSALELYYDGVDITKIIESNDIVYQDDEIRLVKTIVVPEDYKDMHGFDFFRPYKEGLAAVGKGDLGYGYVDKDLNIVIPLEYKYAGDFYGGYATAVIPDYDSEEEAYITVILDKDGNKNFFTDGDSGEIIKGYKQYGFFSEGMLAVSDEGWFHLAYYHDRENYTGNWGCVDHTGREIVKPQYAFRFFFEKGYAIVCRGKYVKTGMTWRSDNELWGIIDKTGKEVVPCEYDEILSIDQTDKEAPPLYQAHSGGWETGKWGIIDASGKWIVKPVFGDIYGDISEDGCFRFSDSDGWSWPEPPVGVYSIPEKRIIFPAEYINITIVDENKFDVQAFDEKHQRPISKIVDRTGVPYFDSFYTFLFEKGNEFYETLIREEGKPDLRGVIDKNGNVIVPCIYEAPIDCVSVKTKRMIFIENGKQGIIDFDGNVLIEPKYSKINGLDDRFLTVELDDKKGLVTHDGREVLSIEFEYVFVYETHITARKDGERVNYRIEQRDLSVGI